MKMNKAEDWIAKLDLLPHPEGGHFKEVYRSEESIISTALPHRFKGDRSFSTSIYYLLKRGEFSKFHRIKSDEIWHFYDGSPLQLIHIDHKGKLIKRLLSNKPGTDATPQYTVHAGQWFAARSTGEFSLMGCTVSPGFDFTDFELADEESLLNEYPQHQEIIRKCTLPL